MQKQTLKNNLETKFIKTEEKPDAFFYENYDSIIKFICPYYDEMIEYVVQTIESDVKSVVDLGCGTGNLLLKIMANNSSVRKVIGFDANPLVLKKASEKFSKYSNILFKFLKDDFLKIDLPIADVCVSSLAIHHQSHEQQMELIKKIINQYPVFIHFEVCKGENPSEEVEKYEFINDYMEKLNVIPLIRKQVLDEMKYKDNPLTVSQHKACCEEAGAHFEIINRMPGFVIYKSESLKVF